MKFLRKLHFSVRKRELEFLPALYLSLWGLWILNPWVNSFPSSPAFIEMGHLAPEWVWGAVIAVVGLFQMTILFTEKYKLRGVAALLSMFALFSMSMLVFFSNYASTGGITYLIIAVCAWLGYTEILADVKRGGGDDEK